MAVPVGGSPRTIVANPSGAPTNSLSFALPTGISIDVESVLAAIDATAAGGTVATLAIADSSGAVIARKRQSEAVTGGVVGSATWALRLGDDGGGGGSGGGLPWAFADAATGGTLPNGASFPGFITSTFVTNDPATFALDGLAQQGIKFLKEGYYRMEMHVIVRSTVAHPVAAPETKTVTGEWSGTPGLGIGFPGGNERAIGLPSGATTAAFWVTGEVFFTQIDAGSVGQSCNILVGNGTGVTLGGFITGAALITKLS